MLCTKNAAWLPFTATPTRRARPTWGSTPCSIAARSRQASPPPTASIWPTSRAWAWSREIFTDDVLAKLPGPMAIGHTRYSTTGDSALLNAQPIRVDSTKGLIAIAHNGNLVNLGNIRASLEREGAYFQTTSDSEIIVQLIAHSKAKPWSTRSPTRCRQIEGAFSIVMMTRDRIFAARDPRGFRPLSMGRIRQRWTVRTRSSLPANPAPSTCCAPSMSATCCPANW
jgi:hypothetical protein